MKKIKYWIFANTFLLLIGPLCIYMNLYRVFGSNGYINASLFLLGMSLYYLNHLTLPLNVILLGALCVNLFRGKQFYMKQFVFVSINAICSIGYIVVYIFYLREAIRVFVV